MEWGSVVAWVSAAVALSSLGFGVWQYRKNRKVKLIAYQVISDEPLVPNIGDPELGNLTVLRDTRPLTYPRSVVVTFTNAGDVEATESQFSTSPKLSLSGDGKIEDSSLIFEAKGSTTRQTVAPASLTETSIEAPKQLMNPGDAWRFRLLIDGRGKIDALAHVEGFEFREGAPLIRSASREMLLWAGFLVTGLIGTILVLYFILYPHQEASCRKELRKISPPLSAEQIHAACSKAKDTYHKSW